MAKELKTDDPEAKEGELCAAPWVLLEPLPAPSREGGGARRLRSNADLEKPRRSTRGSMRATLLWNRGQIMTNWPLDECSSSA